MPPHDPSPKERDEVLAIPLDPEDALRALLRVDPAESSPDDHADSEARPQGRQKPDTDD